MPVSFGLVDRAHLGPSWMCPRLRCGYISTEVRSKHGGRGGGMSGACREIMKKHRNLWSFLIIFCFWSLGDLRGCWLVSFKWCFFHVLDLFFMFLIKPLQARKKTYTDSIIKVNLSAILTLLCFQPASMIGVEVAATSLCLQLICPVLPCITAIHIL